MNRIAASACALLAVALVAAPVAADTAQERFEQTYAFSAGQRLSLENTNGDVWVETWDRDEVLVQATKRVKTRGGASADEVLADVRIEVEVDARGIEIETEYPRRGLGFFGWNDASISVEYDIKVPRRANLELQTVNGEIEVAGVAGDLQLSSTNGGISVVDSAGRVDASTTNGGIRVELDEVADARMEFRTTNGGIRLDLPSSIRASVSARTTNGSIETDFPVTVAGTVKRTRLEGDINGGGPLIEMRTTNGSIRIRER